MLAIPTSHFWPGLYRDRGSRLLWLATILGLVAAIAGVDYLTGYEISLFVAYLVPIFLATWALGRMTGASVACLAVGLWVVAFASHPLSPFLLAWEALLQLAVYIVFVIVLDRLKVAIAHADERFAAVLEGLDALVYVIRPGDGRLLYANQKCRDAFGGAPRNASEIERRFRVRFAEFPPNSPHEPAVPVEVQDFATKKWHWLATQAIRWVDGGVVQLHIATDISTRKQAEETARQHREKIEMSQRLITAGEMASLLAHELNQPLAAIANYNMGCVNRLRSGNWQARDLLEAMEKSVVQARRAGSIIQRVREFLRKREPDLAPSDLTEMIAEVAGLIRAEAARHAINLRFDLDSRLPKALADGIMIRQVLINLIRNAIEAMQAVPVTQRDLLVHSFAESPDTLHVEIADRGPGLPPALAESPFPPLFTTKADGMGMGLQICRSIVEFHGGRLWATENPGGGAVFHFTLAVAKP
jgi:hypothetical protein